MTFDQKKYIADFVKKNYLKKEIKFNKKTESELIDFINKKNNFTNYVKKLIEDDMKKEKGE